MTFEIKPIPSGMKRGWRVLADGKEIDVAHLELVSERFGRWVYGLRPEGFDGLSIYEPGGGGSVTLPFSIRPDGKILVGLLQENRPNMGPNPIWGIIGGFIDPGETHREAAIRETTEESDLDATRAFELEGLDTCANRAYWVTNPYENEGVHAYAFEIPFDSLVPADAVHGGDAYPWMLNDSALLAGYQKRAALRFFEWRKAARLTPDSFARSAILQLLATIL